MLKKIVFSITFSLFLTIGFSQNLQTGSEYWFIDQAGNFQPSTKNLTTFNQYGKQKETISFEWNNNLKTFCPELVTNFQYDDSQRLIQERKREERQPTSLIKDYTNYFYSKDDCLSKVIESDTTVGGVIAHITTTYDSISCRPVSKTYASGTAGNLYPSTIVLYEYDDNIETEKSYNPWPPNNPFRIKKINEITKNDEGQVIKIFKTVYDNQEEVRYKKLIFSEYDDNKNEISNLEFFSNQNDTSFYLQNEILTEYIYDENDKILELNAISSNFEPPSTISSTSSRNTYEYYCDGLLERISHFGSSSSPFAYTTYQYQKGHDCDSSEIDDYLTIRPNQTENNLIIESILLEKRDCQIAVYDMSG